MTYDYEKTYMVYLKSLAEIKTIAAAVEINNVPHKEYQIYHSTGYGGGLPITEGFINRYFGTKKFLDVKHERIVHERQLLKALDTGDTIYDEWVSHVYLKNYPVHLENHLDDELFEI